MPCFLATLWSYAYSEYTYVEAFSIESPTGCPNHTNGLVQHLCNMRKHVDQHLDGAPPPLHPSAPHSATTLVLHAEQASCPGDQSAFVRSILAQQGYARAVKALRRLQHFVNCPQCPCFSMCISMADTPLCTPSVLRLPGITRHHTMRQDPAVSPAVHNLSSSLSATRVCPVTWPPLCQACIMQACRASEVPL